MSTWIQIWKQHSTTPDDDQDGNDTDDHNEYDNDNDDYNDDDHDNDDGDDLYIIGAVCHQRKS